MRISARKGVKFYQNWAISLPVEPVRTPEELAVPLSVVKGETLTLAVQPGDRVEKYQPLAQSENDGCPVCAPCAGRFLEIVERKVPGLGKTPCARIQVQEEDPADVASAIQPPRRTGRYTPSGGAQILEAENAGKKELSLRRLIGIAKRAARGKSPPPSMSTGWTTSPLWPPASPSWQASAPISQRRWACWPTPCRRKAAF